MKGFSYIDGVTTIAVVPDTCVGCGICLTVCPHKVLTLEEKRIKVVNRDACIECGACAKNCPVAALVVKPGVGCASLMIKEWLHEKGLSIKSGSGCC